MGPLPLHSGHVVRAEDMGPALICWRRESYLKLVGLCLTCHCSRPTCVDSTEVIGYGMCLTKPPVFR